MSSEREAWDREQALWKRVLDAEARAEKAEAELRRLRRAVRRELDRLRYQFVLSDERIRSRFVLSDVVPPDTNRRDST